MWMALSGGWVAESGTREEVLAADGTYAELFNLRASPYQWAVSWCVAAG
jgi:hypothetical protein